MVSTPKFCEKVLLKLIYFCRFHLNNIFDRKLLSSPQKYPPCLVFANSLYLFPCISRTALEKAIKPYNYLLPGVFLAIEVAFLLIIFSVRAHKFFIPACTVPHCSTVDRRTTLQSTGYGAWLQHKSFAFCKSKLSNLYGCNISLYFAYQQTRNSSFVQCVEELNHQSFLCSQ